MTDAVGEQLAAWGVVARIETRGRTSGRPVAVSVGYVAEPEMIHRTNLVVTR